MKALSVKQPWAYLLCAGIKDIENRTWRLPEKYKGEIVFIHASGKPDKEPYMLFSDDQIKSIGDSRIINVVESYETTSAIIGSVQFVDCVINHDSIWADKSEIGQLDEPTNEFGKPIYNWVAANPILFDEPIPCKGRLGFWEFDGKVVTKHGKSY